MIKVHFYYYRELYLNIPIYSGSQYDGSGNLVNWWSKEVRQKFNEKAECFINQYSSYFDKEAQMHVCIIQKGENLNYN